MNIIDKIFIWLSVCEIDLATLYDLFYSYPDIEQLWQLTEYKGRIIYHLTSKEFNELVKVRDGGKLDKVIDELENVGKIKYICLYDSRYPNKLRELDYPPFVVYYTGDWSLVDYIGIGIVGSRVCTRYGKEQTAKFAHELSLAGYCIVSGLSEGVDAIAHQETLDCNGKTIAVVANGLKSVYPAINTNLARDIVKKGGLILTEFYPDYVPKNFAFVQRNRIIAALSEGVLVTEARKESGALHTVNFAIDLGRRIFAIPGNINSFASEGTNELIKNFNSVCVTKPSEIIDRVRGDELLREIINQNQRPITKIDKIANLKPEEQKVIDIVERDDAHLDEISRILKIDTKKLLVLLTTMEIRGLIKKLPGNYYGKKD